MDEDERWRRASDWADEFSPFRRRQPVRIGLLTALVATVSLTVFVLAAGLDIRELWIAALVSIVAISLVACGITHLGNHQARSAFIARYRQLNSVDSDSDQKLQVSNVSRRRLQAS
ncbi:MAG: hypothetical protein IT537_18135 [Hyphomicrobiales bacterium]|nr:hypothetical protein [Hyphomicrobiales bacterium]